jgi:hypothetical protein
MKLTIFLAVIALAPASAQNVPMKPAPAQPTARPAASIGSIEVSPMPLQTLRTVEKEMDSRIATTGGNMPCGVLSPSRGVYVSGLGAVFTAEIELAPTPGGMGLFQTIGPEQKAKYHKDKLTNLPLLEKTLSDIVLSLVASPTLKLSDTDQIVVAARLVYRAWEDTNGMPGQIVAHLDRRGGSVKVEVQ